MDRAEILSWLRQTDAERLAALWRQADSVRRQSVGDQVHLRGLVEISNHCVRRCAYCGLRASRRDLPRYRLSADEILAAARLAVDFGYGTVVLQSGEDPGIATEWLAAVIRRVKTETPLAVTLSLGERPDADLAAWRAAGADRYLLRFETSDPALYARIHPPRPGRTGRPNAESFRAERSGAEESRPDSDPAAAEHPRVAILRTLRALGYQIGSGVMIGIPGQTFESLADDLLLFRELDLDMIGVGPYIPHPHTPLAEAVPATGPDQVPATEEMTYRVLALARLVCPFANIPSTTALATLNRAEGRELGLQRGANVVMPNLTPVRYRSLYEIYPAKACIQETASDCHACLARRIMALGRSLGTGRGDRIAVPASVCSPAFTRSSPPVLAGSR